MADLDKELEFYNSQVSDKARTEEGHEIMDMLEGSRELFFKSIVSTYSLIFFFL